MNSYTWIHLVFVILSIWNLNVHARTHLFPVFSFGAVADGETDNTEAFAHAWKNACETPGGVVLVPAGKRYIVSDGDFSGPCNGLTTFQVDGSLVASDDPDLDSNESWITFEKLDNLKLVGNGIFDGNGSSSWSRCRSSSNCRRRPSSLRFHDVRDVEVDGITSKNSKMFHVNIHKAENMSVANVRILAPADSPNTDGIHISSSSHVRITDSTIGTGDDCVSLGDGSSDVNITGVACGPGHGFSIGSLGKYADEEDVTGIRITQCNLTDTDNGLRIKTWAPSKSSNVVSDVTFSHITLSNVDNPIIIDQYYCPNGSCKRKGESSVQIKGVKFIKVGGESASETGIDMQCSKTTPCENMVFSGIDLAFNGEQPTIANCSNVVDVRFQSSNPSRCS